MPMATSISNSPSPTPRRSARVGVSRAATRGLVIALSGDLGAGKTQLVKGVARRGWASPPVCISPPSPSSTNTAAAVCACFTWIFTGSRPRNKSSPPAWKITSTRTASRSSNGRTAGSPPDWRLPGAGMLRQVKIEIVSENERRIIHEDARETRLILASSQGDEGYHSRTPLAAAMSPAVAQIYGSGRNFCAAGRGADELQTAPSLRSPGLLHFSKRGP